MGGGVLELLKSLLVQGDYDGGFTVDRSAEIDGGDLLVTVNGTDYAIQAESF